MPASLRDYLTVITPEELGPLRCGMWLRNTMRLGVVRGKEVRAVIPPQRSDPDKHKAQMRRASQARYAAARRLQAAHPSEWEALYLEEAAARGVTPSFSHEAHVPLPALHEHVSEVLVHEEESRRRIRA